MKYYFITYQATNRQGAVSIWNLVINTNPMQFIRDTQKQEEAGHNTFIDFVILNTLEITSEEFEEWKGRL